MYTQPIFSITLLTRRSTLQVFDNIKTGYSKGMTVLVIYGNFVFSVYTCQTSKSPRASSHPLKCDSWTEEYTDKRSAILRPSAGRGWVMIREECVWVFISGQHTNKQYVVVSIWQTQTWHKDKWQTNAFQYVTRFHDLFYLMPKVFCKWLTEVHFYVLNNYHPQQSYRLFYCSIPGVGNPKSNKSHSL